VPNGGGGKGKKSQGLMRLRMLHHSVSKEAIKLYQEVGIITVYDGSTHEQH
jgi:hypothetical protein